MELQPFIEDVRARAALDNREQAIGAAEATRKSIGTEPSPAPGKSPQSGEGREHRNN